MGRSDDEGEGKWEEEKLTFDVVDPLVKTSLIY